MNNNIKPDLSAGNRENFVSRLYQMLSTPQFAGIVAWNQTEEGPSFVILDTAKFQEYVLVNEFNHANFSSFVRQLNKYDFHKVKFRDPHSRVWEFRHPYFRPENRDKPFLIKRKQQSSGKRMRRGESIVREQTEVAVKAAEIAARDAEDLMKGQVTDLESRVDRLEQNNMQILSALKMQQNLVERLLNVVNLPDTKEDEMNAGDQMIDSYDMPGQQPPQQQQQQQQPQPQETHQARQVPQDGSQFSNQQQQQQQHPGYAMDAMGAGSLPVSPFDTTNHGAYQVYGDGPSVALIAVDDDRVRQVLIKFLLKFGCRVESVDNGLDVVQRVESTQYNYILIDSILKALDGLSAVELIRQTNTSTPILLLSDPASPDEHEVFMQRGVSAVLYRPFSQAKLHSALQQFSQSETSL